MLIIFWVNHKSISCVHIHPHHLSSIVIYHYVSSPINYHHVSSCIVVSSCIITPLTYPLRKKGHDIIVYHHGASSNLESPHLGLRGRRVGQHFNSLQEFGRTPLQSPDAAPVNYCQTQSEYPVSAGWTMIACAHTLINFGYSMIFFAYLRNIKYLWMRKSMCRDAWTPVVYLVQGIVLPCILPAILSIQDPEGILIRKLQMQSLAAFQNSWSRHNLLSAAHHPGDTLRAALQNHDSLGSVGLCEWSK